MDVHRDLLVAILADEPDAGAFLARIETAGDRKTGAHVRLEATSNLARILGIRVADAQDMYDAVSEAAGITVVSITDAIARRAVDAFALYAKGKGHPAQLNFADCLSYACATFEHAPMLFEGQDISRTACESALG